MSIFATLASVVKSMLGESVAEIPASAPIATVAGVRITWGSLKALDALYDAIPSADIKKLLTDAGNVSNDAAIAGDIADTIALTTPYAFEVDLAVEAVQWLIAINTNPTIGAPTTPAFKEGGR